MKPLIAVTCVAVLATVGYLGWGELQKVQAAQKAADWQEVESACSYSLQLFDRNRDHAFVDELQNCVDNGHLNRAMVDLAFIRAGATLR